MQTPPQTEKIGLRADAAPRLRSLLFSPRARGIRRSVQRSRLRRLYPHRFRRRFPRLRPRLLSLHRLRSRLRNHRPQLPSLSRKRLLFLSKFRRLPSTWRFYVWVCVEGECGKAHDTKGKIGPALPCRARRAEGFCVYGTRVWQGFWVEKRYAAASVTCSRKATELRM